MRHLKIKGRELVKSTIKQTKSFMVVSIRDQTGIMLLFSYAFFPLSYMTVIEKRFAL